MPRRVGKYTIEGTLGGGSSGTVYLAIDPDLERRVAVKELSAALAHEPGFLERFREEAAIMARLSHPNCVAVYDFLEERRTAYIVSEYIDGASLRAVLGDAGRLSPEQALGVTRGALTGLAHAHELGLVHRDIKPENLLADLEGTSKLADFGQAIFTGELQGGPRQATGTPAYMSPEQVRGEQGDVRSDVYSCGALMFELLAGRPPFIGLSRLAVMRMHVEREPPDLARVNPRIAPRLAGVVAQALAKEPQDRYGSAGDFLAVLEEAATREYGARWLSSSSIAGLVATVAASRPPLPPLHEEPEAVPEPEAGAAEVAEAEAGTAPEPEPPPAPEPEPEPTAVAAAPDESSDLPGEEDGSRPRVRLLGRRTVTVAVAAGLLVGGAVGYLLPYAPSGGASSPAPSPGSATVLSISAHFDDASSTTIYQVQGARPGATYRWGWLKKPPCGSLEADPGGLVAGYSHNGCNQVAEAAGLVGLCESSAQGNVEYQRNARYGDGALSPGDAQAAGVSSDQFAVVGNSGSADFCTSLFPDTASAIVTPVPGAPAAAEVSPSPSPGPSGSAPADPTGYLVGTALVGVALLMLGSFVVRRSGDAG